MNVWIAIALSIMSVLITIGGIVFSAGRKSSEVETLRGDFRELKKQTAPAIEVDALKNSLQDLRRHVDRTEASVSALRTDSTDEVKDIRDDLKGMLAMFKEFAGQQTAVNVAVSKSIEVCTTRLERIGDITIEQKAKIESAEKELSMQWEVLRRKGIVQG